MLPNLTRLAEDNGYSPFKVCAPPQTEVSWTSIATGADPGSHGIFDFVHRTPETYMPYVSILPTHTSALGTQFTAPYTARTMFDEAVEQGFPATALWWPAMFPPTPVLLCASSRGWARPISAGNWAWAVSFRPKTGI